MKRTRMLQRMLQPEDLVVGETYVLVRDRGQRECATALWDGKEWVVEHGELAADWPDAVFEGSGKARIAAFVTLDEHQAWVKEHAFYEGDEKDLTYPALGLCGEAGEFAEKVKKSIRDDGGVVTPERKADMVNELGDVLFYLCMAARKLGVGMSDVADANVRKLEGRRARGVLAGSGDNR